MFVLIQPCGCYIPIKVAVNHMSVQVHVYAYSISDLRRSVDGTFIWYMLTTQLDSF